MKTFTKPVLTTVNRKVPYRTYLAFTVYRNLITAQSGNTTKAARTGPRHNFRPGPSKGVQNGQN